MITILRLSHRISRDKRLSSHLGLTARAFGADKVVYTGEKDENLYKSLRKVSNEWGGNFEIEYAKSYRKVIKEFPGTVIHLTMYGLPVQDTVSELKGKDLLIVVGAGKVPGDVYELSDYNISVTLQPHSEVAALAILLDRLSDGKQLSKTYSNAKKKVIPNPKGKTLTQE
ncbi:tRNA (cytidine(56)-2'-O)-methyltransferase [Candidatus Undinarchaeota archaeon]